MFEVPRHQLLGQHRVGRIDSCHDFAMLVIGATFRRFRTENGNDQTRERYQAAQAFGVNAVVRQFGQQHVKMARQLRQLHTVTSCPGFFFLDQMLPQRVSDRVRMAASKVMNDRMLQRFTHCKHFLAVLYARGRHKSAAVRQQVDDVFLAQTEQYFTDSGSTDMKKRRQLFFAQLDARQQFAGIDDRLHRPVKPCFATKIVPTVALPLALREEVFNFTAFATCAVAFPKTSREPS